MAEWKKYYCLVVATTALTGLVSNSTSASLSDRIDLNIVDLNKNLTVGDMRVARASAREQLRFHSRHFDFNRPLTLRVRLFRRPNRYRDWRNRTTRSRSEGGYYSRRLDEATVNHHKYYQRTIAHEIQHQIFAKLMRRPPRWLDEGLSEFYEHMAWSKGRPYVFKGRRAMETLRKWDNSGAKPSLRQIMSMKASEFARQDVGPNWTVRSISWALIYFMMTSSAGERLLSDAIGEQLKNPRRRSDLIMDAIYPGGVDNLERDLRADINRLPRTKWLR